MLVFSKPTIHENLNHFRWSVWKLGISLLTFLFQNWRMKFSKFLRIPRLFSGFENFRYDFSYFLILNILQKSFYQKNRKKILSILKKSKSKIPTCKLLQIDKYKLPQSSPNPQKISYSNYFSEPTILKTQSISNPRLPNDAESSNSTIISWNFQATMTHLKGITECSKYATQNTFFASIFAYDQ